MSRPFSAARGSGSMPVDAMTDVGGVGRLAHLAVADDVDAGRDLLGDDLIHRLGGRGLELRGVDRLALFAAENEVDQRLRPRQAAGVRGENSVGAGFHVRQFRIGVADLTFLPELRRVLRRNVKSKATPEHRVASVPLVPTLVNARAAKGYTSVGTGTLAAGGLCSGYHRALSRGYAAGSVRRGTRQ